MKSTETISYNRQGEWGGVTATISEDGVKISTWSAVQGEITGRTVKYYFPLRIGNDPREIATREQMVELWDDGYNDLYTYGDMVLEGCIRSAHRRVLRHGHEVE